MYCSVKKKRRILALFCSQNSQKFSRSCVFTSFSGVCIQCMYVVSAADFRLASTWQMTLLTAQHCRLKGHKKRLAQICDVLDRIMQAI